MVTKSVPRRRVARRRALRGEVFPVELASVPCGFCGGTRLDPFGIMSPLSACCVCGGNGTVLVRKPYVRCAFCEGTGVYPNSRLTCTACAGLGVSPVKEPNKTCPNCLGTGVDPHTQAGFYCLACHGAGVAAEGR